MNVRTILWSSFLFATLLYGILAYAAERQYTLQPLSAAIRRPVTIVLYGAALAVFLVGFFGGRGMDRRAPSPAPGYPPRSDVDRRGASANSMQAFVIRLALFEAVAILGLVAAFVIHDWRLYLPAWALAIIGMLRIIPRSSA